MAHQSHIKSEKYRQWVKAGLGLHYLKEGLAPFCDDISKQQHKDILDNIKRVKHVPSVKCGSCTLKTLRPDHVKLGNKQCPFGHVNCNCWYTSGKTPCTNNVCGAIYDSIITYHASTPPAPNWKNTQAQQWSANPWSFAKCFINAPGYEQKTSAADTDCTGLLHVIINNKYFHKHVSCKMTGPNIFSKVRQYRNEIFHSSTMELDSQTTNSYIDDMIAVLRDCKELIHRQDAQEAVKKLQDLKNEDFVVTTQDVEQILGDRDEIRHLKITMEATKEDFEDLKLKVAKLETGQKEKKTDFDTLRADLREKLIEEYRQNILQVSAMPCQPEHLCDFRDVYVTPNITIKSKHNDKQDIETDVETLSDIFFKDDKPLKSIYIIGEAGSGKSSFCKNLVYCWCMAHSNTQDLDGQEAQKYNVDLVGSIKVMKNFNFLFFLPLRNCTDKVSIKEMLEVEYKHPVLQKLLERESETCLIVLDGLDEWTHTTKCPPKREKFSNSTVITTSRPWKIGSLDISNNEMMQSFHIRGFDDICKKIIIKKTVNILNTTFKKDKDPQNCEEALKNKSFICLSKTAMMIQQLICLWFDDRLIATSKCNLYTCMLDLFFVWYKKKVPDAPLFKDKMYNLHGIELPECLNKTGECKSQSYIVQGVSRLAYETLIKNEKEKSLTFDSSMFQQLGLSDDIKDCCLKLGILSEETSPSLSASRGRKSHISFSHKSIQEYLAALYIVLNINPGKESSLDNQRADVSDDLSKMLNVKTLDELLEQENVLIILCGLEPRLAKYISKFIYNIVARDKRVVKYRTTLKDDYRHFYLIKDVQNLTLNCIDETKASTKNHEFSFDLGDLFIGKDKYHTCLNASVYVQNITLDSVISIRTNNIMFPSDASMFDCMTKCNNLQTIYIINDFKEELNQRICDSIEASTLKCLSVKGICSSRLSRPLFRHIANMTDLVALRVEGITVTHSDVTVLCSFLSRTDKLKDIAIDITCKYRHQHKVDLSQHKQLHYLEYKTTVVVTHAEFSNLEVIKCFSLNRMDCIQVLDTLSHSRKLKEIILCCDSSSEKVNLANGSDPLNCHASVTNRLITFLPSFQQLRKLTLEEFTFTANIVTRPSEMKSLEFIDLVFVRMSLTTWRKFVDSVAKLPHVEIIARHMCITPDGDEYNPDIPKWSGGGGGKEKAAFKYVKEHATLFDVSLLPLTLCRIGENSTAIQYVTENDAMFDALNISVNSITFSGNQ